MNSLLQELQYLWSDDRHLYTVSRANHAGSICLYCKGVTSTYLGEPKHAADCIVLKILGKRDGDVRLTVDISEEDEEPKSIWDIEDRYAFVLVGAKLVDDLTHNRIQRDAQLMIDADMRNWAYSGCTGDPDIDRLKTFWRNPNDPEDSVIVFWDGDIIP